MNMQSNPAERRRFPRTQLTLPIQAIRLDPDGDVVEPMQLIDISRGGVGAVAHRPFYPGVKVLLKLPTPGMGVRNICAVIRRCRKSDEGYRLGIEFDSPIASLCADASLPIVAAA